MKKGCHVPDDALTRCPEGHHNVRVGDLRGYCEHVKRQPALAKFGKDGDAMCEPCWNEGKRGGWRKLSVKMMCGSCLLSMVAKARTN